VTKFDQLEATRVNLEREKIVTNENGSLAWGTSYLLDAYLHIYEATGDPKYLSKFVALADAVANQTDARRRVTDYKGRARVGWGASGKYSQHGERIVWLAHSAMLVYPLARFALLVKETPSLAQYATKTRSYQELAEAALHEFDSQWRRDPKSGGGFYVFEKDEPAANIPAGEDFPVPFNMQLLAGRVFIVLWKLTGNSAYREKAEALGKQYKSNLTVDSNGAYVSHYWYGKGLTVNSHVEDFSHATEGMNFAVDAGREGIVFTPSDLKPFVGTFFRYADTGGGTMLKPSTTAGLWLVLSEVDCRVYRAAAPYLMSLAGVQHPVVLEGIAQLAHYYKQCGSN
jgi:hypothetical protein